ncbi:sigma-70 family RNA polymerase sigma factor [Clostridium tarantellae]|uniref:Sigma-70 family RNA polymerase sigma factor n=1 Tax=Clostridium tarantellae TaxID=39493 RepID=A0A6I1MM90_9CLOT|nr:sigma-70 family RNA polymerase sigma factor [Clostridium tarantellae]
MYNTYETLDYYTNEEDRLNNSFSKGGEHELNLAIELYGQALLKYCHNILCDYYEAEDAVQMTFVKAYNKRQSFKTGTSLSAWLYRIAYTTCIDITRKRRFQIFSNKYEKKHEPIYDDTYINEELREALLQLTPKDRALVFSRILDEKEYSELEIIYDASAATLRKRYERAKKKLAKALRKNQNEY